MTTYQPPSDTATFHDVRLPSGIRLDQVEQRWTLHGTPARDGGNVVLLFHSLTGGTDPGAWWPTLVGEGRLLDPRRWAILTPALLGGCSGTGNPERLPPGLTPRDMAHMAGLLLDHLGIPRARLAAGGSVGGMVALEWAASFPVRSDAVVVFAAPAAHTAQGIAFNRIQREALRLGGPVEGLALAREMAMLTYRTAAELEARFGRKRQEEGAFEVNAWLAHHGRRLVERFHPASYRLLLDVMDAHDVGLDRGGPGPALRAFQGHLVGVGIEGDLLYPPGEIAGWVRAAGGAYRELRSIHGHDAFLLEEDQVGAILAEALAESSDPRDARVWGPAPWAGPQTRSARALSAGPPPPPSPSRCACGKPGRGPG